MADDDVRLSLTLEAAQMLKTLAEVNAEAGSIPEILKNVEVALDAFAQKFGLSFGAAQKAMGETLIQAEELRALLQNPITAPTVLMSPNALKVAGAANPFAAGGMSTEVGLKAMNDQRAAGLALTKQEAASEAAVAKEINEAKLAEERKAAALKNTIRLQMEENHLLAASARIREQERITREAQKFQALRADAAPNEASEQGLSEAYRASGDSLIARNKAVMAGVDLNKVSANSIGSVIEGHNKLGAAATTAGEATKKATSGMVGGINLVRTAMHVLAASAIFAVIGAFTKLFSMAITGLRELETATYNIVNAERKLSAQGVEITPKDLDGYIKKLQVLNPLLSKIQATELVSTVATKVAPNLGLNKEEIESFSESIAILQVRLRGLGKSEEEVQNEALNAILSGRVVGLNKMGIKISEQIVLEKALAMGLVKSAEAYKNLTGAEEESIKAKTIVQLLKENTNLERSHLPEYFQTADAAFGVFQARLQDFLTEIGVKFGPLLTDIFQSMINNLEVLLKWIGDNENAVDLFVATLRTFLKITVAISEFMNKLGATVTSVFRIGATGIEKFNSFLDAAAKKFPGIADALKDLKIVVNSLAASPDTPTAPLPPVVINTDEAKKELEDLLKDLEKLQKKIDETEGEHKIKLSRFDEDAKTDRGRAVADYNLNVLQTTRAFNLKKKDENKKYRQKEIEEERKFNEDMRKLQEEFLFSLEDALRERDARQVLRLVDKYKMDVDSATNAESIRKKTAAENFTSEQADNKKQLEEKLRVMAEDQAVKMQRMDEDSALKRARMEEDHAAEMAKLREQLAERIQEAATKMAEELGVNEAGAKAIYDLLAKYYGTGGALDLLTQQGYARMLANAQGFLSQLTGIVAAQQGIMAGAASTPSYAGAAMAAYGISPHGGVTPGRTVTKPATYTQKSIPKYAEGGQFVATRPTPFIAGEAGNEFVSITPFSQMQGGSNATSFGGTDSPAGMINLAVTLSPDLNAEIVNKALDKVALTIEHIRREK